MASHFQTRKELERTWQAYRSLPPSRLLRDAWPRVVPEPGGTLETSDTLNHSATGFTSLAAVTRTLNATCSPPPPRSSVGAWVTALVAFDELQSYRDVDTLSRRAVELLRTALGLERAAIFVLRDEITLHGTFGTGPNGETTDERHIAFELGCSHREAFALASQGLAQWSRFPNVPLFSQRENQTVVLRTGENVIIPILFRGRALGLIACDQGLTGATINAETLLRTAVFARILAPLLTEAQSEALSTTNSSVGFDAPAASFTTQGPNVELVGAAIRRLRLDPNEPRDHLAKALGTTADRLGRVFKAELGESLPDYRNKLRLQRFLALVDPNGGDLLPAALSAGFGSYAQFNRVFHECFGLSPIAYLRQRQVAP